MNYCRSSHTMINDGKYIYVVGGEDLDTVEKYDIIENKWIIIPPMNSKRMLPILSIYNGFLYTFFGKSKNNQNIESIERINLNNNNAKWEMIMFSNPKNIDLRFYGCAVYEKNGLLYFFGGKCNEIMSDLIFYYDFEDRCFGVENMRLNWKESFRENKMYPMGGNNVQISDSKYNEVRIRLEEK